MKLAAFSAVGLLVILLSICWVQDARVKSLKTELAVQQRELDRLRKLIPPGAERTLARAADRHRVRNELNQMREDVELIRRIAATNSAALAGQTTKRKAATPLNSPARKPILEDPELLVNRLLQGDRAALAGLSDLAREALSLTTTNSASVEPFQPLREAFIRLGQAAGAGDLNALNALWRATRDDYLSALAVEGLGRAAALGQEDAMEMLLNPAEFGLLESSALSALSSSAQNQDERAINAIAAFAYQPENSALWSVAAQALEPAAMSGNQVALEALLEIARHQQQGADTARQALERAALENQPLAQEALQSLLGQQVAERPANP
jgi:hypothetical protein